MFLSAPWGQADTQHKTELYPAILTLTLEDLIVFYSQLWTTPVSLVTAHPWCTSESKLPFHATLSTIFPDLISGLGLDNRFKIDDSNFFPKNLEFGFSEWIHLFRCLDLIM